MDRWPAKLQRAKYRKAMYDDQTDEGQVAIRYS